ncbi:MAG: hypothetical protein WD645_03530 [Dehalococcoidia bacterium]
MTDDTTQGAQAVQYRRNANGTVIHVDGCARAGSSLPWNYASGLSPVVVQQVIDHYGWLRWCRVCKPAEVSR